MLKYLNKYGEELPFKDVIELQWSRKWNECGSFAIYVAAKDYDPEVKYVQLKDRPETGIVQKTVYEKKSNGDFVTLSGFFIEKLAEWGSYETGIFVNKGSGIQTSEEVRKAVLRTLYHTFTQFFPKEDIGPDGGDFAPLSINSYGTKVSGEMPTSMDFYIPDSVSIGKAFYNWVESLGYSYYCKPIFNPGKATKEATEPLIGLEFVFCKGKDKSKNVYFGAPWNNVSKIDYALDDSAEKPAYLIMQEIDKEHITGFLDVKAIPRQDGTKYYIRERVLESANAPKDVGKVYPIKVLYSTVSGIEMAGANESNIREKMRQQGRLDMLNNYKVENISADVIQNRFYYLKDYDLGDVCSVAIDEIKQMYTAKIVEVNEVHHKNTVDIQIVLGTPQKQQYRKVMV